MADWEAKSLQRMDSQAEPQWAAGLKALPRLALPAGVAQALQRPDTWGGSPVSVGVLRFYRREARQPNLYDYKPGHGQRSREIEAEEASY